MLKSKGKVLLIAMALSAVGTFASFAEEALGWQKTENGEWKFYLTNGELATNEWTKSGYDWYYFDENGNMVFNALVQEDEGKTYYVDAEGKMSANQWVYYNDIYYYAGEDGAILKSTLTPDGYTVDENGAWNQNIPQQVVDVAEQEAITIQIPDAQGYGTVTGNITWQYNKYIGTRGDTGSEVYLIPMDFSIKGGDNKNLSLFLDTRGKNNVFYVEVDGRGQYVLNNIPCGKYLIFIRSENTTDGMRFTDKSTWNKIIDKLLGAFLTDDELETFKTMLGYNSFYFDTITVQDGQTITISHDFGYTYI